MPRLILRVLPVFLFVFFCVLPAETRADTIVITSGSLTVGLNSTLGNYSLTGLNFSATGRGRDFGAVTANCDSCRPGMTLNLGSNFVGESSTLGRGAATINGIFFQEVHFAGQFRFITPNVVLPDLGIGLVTITAPFDFQSTLMGCTAETMSGGCRSPGGSEIFSTTLSGQGIATLQLFGFLDPSRGHVYSFRSLTYDFQPTPTPEPATMLLLGTGLAGVGAYYRRRRAMKN